MKTEHVADGLEMKLKDKAGPTLDTGRPHHPIAPASSSHTDGGVTRADKNNQFDQGTLKEHKR